MSQICTLQGCLTPVVVILQAWMCPAFLQAFVYVSCQTWDLSKKFTPPYFQPKDFTPLISLNFNSFSGKNTKNECFWRNLHHWQKILHCRRQCRQWQISPLCLVIGFVQACTSDVFVWEISPPTLFHIWATCFQLFTTTRGHRISFVNARSQELPFDY